MFISFKSQIDNIDRTSCSIHWFILPESPPLLGLRMPNMSLGLSSGLPCGRQAPRYSRCSALPSMGHISRTLEVEAESELKPSHSHSKYRYLKGNLNDPPHLLLFLSVLYMQDVLFFQNWNSVLYSSLVFKSIDSKTWL